MSTSAERMRRMRARHKRNEALGHRPWRVVRLEELAERLKLKLAAKIERHESEVMLEEGRSL